MLNRKGQSLVVFILLLPIILGIIVLVIDVGGAMVVKNRMDSVICMVMDISLDKNMSEDSMLELLRYNLSDNDNKVLVYDGNIVIDSGTYVKGIFSNMFGFSGFYVESEYVGRVIDGIKKVDKKR